MWTYECFFVSVSMAWGVFVVCTFIIPILQHCFFPPADYISQTHACTRAHKEFFWLCFSVAASDQSMWNSTKTLSEQNFIIWSSLFIPIQDVTKTHAHPHTCTHTPCMQTHLVGVGASSPQPEISLWVSCMHHHALYEWHTERHTHTMSENGDYIQWISVAWGYRIVPLDRQIGLLCGSWPSFTPSQFKYLGTKGLH